MGLDCVRAYSAGEGTEGEGEGLGGWKVDWGERPEVGGAIRAGGGGAPYYGS